MKKNKQHKRTRQRRQQTRLAATVTTSAISLALPALLTAAPNTPLVEVPLFPAPEAQGLLLLAYTPQHAQSAAVDKYFGEGYTYCDAKVLAAFWGEATPYDAKVRLGDKMLRWGPDDAQAHVPDARAQALQKGEQGEWVCAWDGDGGYTLDDAGLLADYWDKGYGETKTKIRRLLVQGKNADIQAALQNAKANSTSSSAGGQQTEQAAVDKYFLEGYTYCDAKVLAAFWGEATPWDAKVRLGQKMLSWGPDDAQAHVPPAREQALQKPVTEMPCWYDDGGYSYDDAGLLAAYWGEESELDAKYKITRLLVQGKNADIQAALQNARASHDSEA